MNAGEQVRRIAAEVEEDEQIASMCHAVFLDHLRGPLADRVEPLVAAARARGDHDQAEELVAGYWDLVDRSLLGAEEASDALEAAARAWREECARRSP